MSRHPGVHVAQLNVGTMIAPTDDPRVGEFMAALDRINAIADEAPGFVWRLQTDEGNATSIQVFPDPLQLVNLSVWESIDELKAYVYRSEHVEFFRRRAEWFEPGARRAALWWIPAGTQPELEDAVGRLEFLERHGPSPYAFGFSHPSEPFLIEAVRLDDPDARALTDRLEAEAGEHLVDRDGPRQDTAVAGEQGSFLVARLAGAPVACGAVHRIGDSRGEIGTWYVTPEARGRKIGAALLDRLETVAARLGLHELVLEAGVHQHAAIALARGAGYSRAELGPERAGPPGFGYRKVLTPRG